MFPSVILDRLGNKGECFAVH